jgi:crossover junction endodeoxyribonuclease RusA
VTNYTIRLPWPPAALTPHAKGGLWGKIKATRDYRQAAYILARAAGVERATGAPAVRIVVTYHPPSQRGDVANVHGRLKAAFDGLADALGLNDKTFRIAFPEVFGPSKKGGEVVCELEVTP